MQKCSAIGVTLNGLHFPGALRDSCPGIRCAVIRDDGGGRRQIAVLDLHAVRYRATENRLVYYHKFPLDRSEAN